MSPQQLQDALNHQKMNGGKLGKAFVEPRVRQGRGDHEPALAPVRGAVDQPRALRGRSRRSSRSSRPRRPKKYQVLPLSRSGATLTIAMADPTNVFAMDDIKFMTGYNVEPVVASETALDDAIDRYYGSMRSLELRRDTAPVAGRRRASRPGGGTSLKEVLDGPTLSVDDMAAIGGLSEIDLDSMADADADVETVKSDDDEIDLGNLAKSADAAPVVKLHERAARRLAQARGLRHPHRALREGVPRPLPHRRDPLQRHGAAHEAEGPAASPASRSWPSSTSRRSGSPRTGASRSR